MATSQTQVARLLAMVPYLLAHQGIAVNEAAAAFDITTKQLLADLNVVWMCGLPGGMPDDLIEIDMDAVEGQGVIYLTNADYLSRPLRFTRDEAVALVVALQAIREMATGEFKAAAETAAAKLSAITGQDDPVWLAVSTGDDLVRAELSAAIEAQRRVQLTYDGATRGQTTRPVVDPAEIAMRDSVAYLQAWSLDRRAWRTYRLDRIVEVTDSAQPSDQHGPAPALPDGWFDSSDGQVVLVLTPQASWVVDYYLVDDVQRLPDGSLSARFTVAEPAWLEALLLRLGDQVRQLSPPQAGRSAAQAAAAAIAISAAWFD